MRSAWKGSLRFSLVSIPVEAFTASEAGGGEVHLHQLHAKCHSRIRYVKTCPIHGAVPNSEIVSGFEHSKGQYVVVDRKELDKAESSRSIAIETFVPPDVIDPLYFDGRTYFLTPGEGGEESYAVLYEAMEHQRRWGVALVTLHGKEHLVAVRPWQSVLTMSMLHYENQVRQPSTVKTHLPSHKAKPQEIKLAEQLIEASTEKRFSLAQYKDRENETLRKLIDTRIRGKKTIRGHQEETPVINLMDALRKSVRQAAKPLNKRGAPSRPQHRKSS